MVLFVAGTGVADHLFVQRSAEPQLQRPIAFNALTGSLAMSSNASHVVNATVQAARMGFTSPNTEGLIYRPSEKYIVVNASGQSAQMGYISCGITSYLSF